MCKDHNLNLYQLNKGCHIQKVNHHLQLSDIHNKIILSKLSNNTYNHSLPKEITKITITVILIEGLMMY